MPKLTITQGPGSGTEYEVERAAILGRLETNDVPIHDKKASREHAKIYRQGQSYAVVDLNSSNGTFVNGEQITKRVLKPGDEITIGMVHLLFEYPEAEAAAAAAPRRKSLEDAFDSAGGGRSQPAAAATATADSIQLSGHEPIQYRRIKGGRSGAGFDFDQLSPFGRLLATAIVLAVFAGLIYLGYVLMAG